MRPKYKMTLKDLETRHNVAKLERDGFDRRQIIKEMYKLTDGAPQTLRTELVSKLYDRSEK